MSLLHTDKLLKRALNAEMIKCETTWFRFIVLSMCSRWYVCVCVRTDFGQAASPSPHFYFSYARGLDIVKVNRMMFVISFVFIFIFVAINRCSLCYTHWNAQPINRAHRRSMLKQPHSNANVKHHKNRTYDIGGAMLKQMDNNFCFDFFLLFLYDLPLIPLNA